MNAEGEGGEALPGEETDPALAGLAASVISVSATIVTALLVASGPLAAFHDAEGATLDVPFTTVLGWAFYAAHGVPLRVQTDGKWTLDAALVGSPVLYVVPPVTLLVGGYFVTRLAAPSDLREGARTGATVAFGYAAVAIGGLLLTGYGIDSSFAEVTARPDTLLAVVTGVAYPVVFGGAGGAVAAAVDDRTTDARQRRLERSAVAVLAVLLVAAVALAAL